MSLNDDDRVHVEELPSGVFVLVMQSNESRVVLEQPCQVFLKLNYLCK